MSDTQNKQRPKLTIEGQISYMQNMRGIKFNIVSVEEAAEFLQTSNYYFKLKAFAKNFSKFTNPSHPQYGQYCNLDFAYLQELSTLDMHLREIVLSMSLDIEHYLKVRLLRDISENDKEDGYTIVQEFLAWHPNVAESIQAKAHNSYCEALVQKYSNHYSVWTFIEVISFGDLIDFCDLYYSKYPQKDISIGNYRIVKFLRNAAAHNNCLINNLADNSGEGFNKNRMACKFVDSVEGISDKTRTKKMGNRTVHDFVVLLCTFASIASDGAKKRQFAKLRELFDVRFLKRKEYFMDNMLLVTNYQFLQKVVAKITETH